MSQAYSSCQLIALNTVLKLTQLGLVINLYNCQIKRREVALLVQRNKQTNKRDDTENMTQLVNVEQCSDRCTLQKVSD